MTDYAALLRDMAARQGRFAEKVGPLAAKLAESEDQNRTLATALTAAEARIAELEALLSWQPIAAAPNGESILIMRDDWSMQVIHAEDNDYDWMPWEGEVGDGWVSPMLWFPAEGLVKAAEAAIAALNPGDPK